jgi:hypothetical protein
LRFVNAKLGAAFIAIGTSDIQEIDGPDGPSGSSEIQEDFLRDGLNQLFELFRIQLSRSDSTPPSPNMRSVKPF